MLRSYFILFVSLWAFTASPILIRYSTLPAPWIVTFRLIIALALLLPLWWWERRKHPKSALPFLTPRLFYSGLTMGTHFTLWTLSLNYTSVSSATIAVCCSPIFVILLAAIFYKRTFSTITFLSLIISVIGTVFLFFNDLSREPHGVKGILLALLAAFLYAIYILIGEHERQERRLLSYVIPVYTVATGVALLWALFAQPNPLAQINVREVVVMASLALIPTILGHTALNYLLKYLNATTLSIAGLTQPFLATMMALILFHEIPGAWGMVGSCITILGVFLCLKTQANEPLSNTVLE